MAQNRGLPFQKILRELCSPRFQARRAATSSVAYLKRVVLEQLLVTQSPVSLILEATTKYDSPDLNGKPQSPPPQPGFVETSISFSSAPTKGSVTIRRTFRCCIVDGLRDN